MDRAKTELAKDDFGRVKLQGQEIEEVNREEQGRRCYNRSGKNKYDRSAMIIMMGGA